MNSDLIINNNEGILEIVFNRPERKNISKHNICFEQMSSFGARAEAHGPRPKVVASGAWAQANQREKVQKHLLKA